MHRNTKVATCCYCGTRAALVLDFGRHELSCQGCGAPLHELKSMPMRSGPGRKNEARSAKGHRFSDLEHARRPAKPKAKKQKKKKSRSKWLFEEAFDLIEDIFD